MKSDYELVANFATYPLELEYCVDKSAMSVRALRRLDCRDAEKLELELLRKQKMLEQDTGSEHGKSPPR